MTPSPKISQKISVIDGLRGLAIAAVVYQHLYAVLLMDAVRQVFGITNVYILGHGWLGVGLFFTLSGFVLALPYFDGQRRLDHWPDIRDFYRRRIKRLMPLLLVVSCASAGLWLHQQGTFPWRTLALTVTTTNIFTSSQFFPEFNGPLWSLSLEVWFSILFPVLLLAVTRFGIKRVLIASLVIAFIIRIPGSQFAWINPNVNPIKDSIPARLDDFMLGIAIAWLFARGKLPQLGPRALATGFALLALVAIGWDMTRLGTAPKLIEAPLNNIAQISFFLIITALLNNPLLWRGMFTSKYLTVPGKMCFSIYVWHGPLLLLFHVPTHPTIATHIQYWIALAAVSTFSYRFIEFPSRPQKSVQTPPREFVQDSYMGDFQFAEDTDAFQRGPDKHP